MSKLFEEESEIKPVWQVIPQFFRYPFGGKVLPLLIGISLAAVLTLIPILGFFALILIWMMLFKISYEILTSTARGELDGPPAVTQVSGGIMFQHIGMLIGMALIYFAAVVFVGSLTFAILFGIFLMLCLPAAIMTLAMTQSLFQALNPVLWIDVMRRSGPAYLLTSVFLLLMLMSQAQAEAILLPLVGGSMLLLVILSTFISGYFMAASFHLMGYLLYQRHEDFGIEIKSKTGLARPEDQEIALINEARQMVQDGRVDEAAAALRQEIDRRGAEPAVHDYYRQLAGQLGDHSALVEHGRQYVPILLHAAEDLNKALEVAEACLGLDKDFEPANPDDVLPLAQRAFDQSRYPLVLKLTRGFARRHPNHHHVVDNYLLAARTLVEHKGDTDKARALLGKLKRKFPHHRLAEEVSRLEASLA